jgi:hypothetical protein
MNHLSYFVPNLGTRVGQVGVVYVVDFQNDNIFNAWFQIQQQLDGLIFFTDH